MLFQDRTEAGQRLGQQLKAYKNRLWEHNSHLGDARATDMGKTGESKINQNIK